MQALISMITAKKLNLHDFHKVRSAKFTNFAGWEMPVSYGSSVAEHMAVREKVGLFDVSHMGEFLVHGPDALPFLEYVLTNDISKIVDGQAMYSLMCNQDGGVLDDLIVYRISHEKFFLCVNASNIDSDYSHLSEQSIPFDCSVDDESNNYGLLAIQGPQSKSLLENVLGEQYPHLRKMHFIEISYVKKPAICARTGYTGEDGFEIFLPIDVLHDFANQISNTQDNDPSIWVGLAARDSLRLEAGFSLHGHEITEKISPFEAGLMWAVSKVKNDFIGREALFTLKNNNLAGRVLHYTVNDRRIPRENSKVYLDQSEAGVVLSGGYSPLLGVPIGTAYIENKFVKNKEALNWSAEVRGKAIPIKFSKPALKQYQENEII